LLATNPDDAFTVPELCREVYGESAIELRSTDQCDGSHSATEKKHRVAVLRAAKALIKTHPEINCFGSTGFGIAFFNQASVMSYARARLKARGR
jgi:hypothetical protein